MKFKKLLLALCFSIFCINYAHAESQYDRLINYCYNGSYTNGYLHVAEQCFNDITIDYPNEGEAYFWLGMINWEKGIDVIARIRFEQNLKCGNPYRQSQTYDLLRKLGN